MPVESQPPESLRLPPDNFSDQIDKLFDLESHLFREDFITMCTLKGRPLGEYQNPKLNNLVLSIHKFLFLTGGEEADVITARDPWGNHIYTKLFHGKAAPNENDSSFREYYPVKEGEIQEANSAISKFIQIVRSAANTEGIEHWKVDLRKFLHSFELPEVLSEIADIVYNMLNISRLDTGFSYETHIHAIGDSLGYSYEQLLYLITLKYYHRYIDENGKKDIMAENMLIARALESETLPIPTLGQLSRTYNEINVITHSIIHTRMTQLKTDANRMLRNAKA